MPKKQDNKAFLAHFPKTINKAICKFAIDTALLSSRYLFVRRYKSNQYGYCTHCKMEYMTDSSKLKHNESTQCKRCKSLVTVKHAGVGRNSLVDDAYFVWYEKSVVNPDAIVAFGLYVKRDYTKDYHNTETEFRTAAMYLFEPGSGQGKMIRFTTYRSGWWGQGATILWNDNGTEPESTLTEFENSMRNKSCFLAVESVVPAVQGTPFQYSTWSQYVDLNDDLVQFFDLATRYRCIEFLTKIGLRSMVVAKLAGQATYGAINWHGQTPEKVLRLTKSEIKEMTKVGAIGARTLRSYQTSKKDGSNLDWQDARALSDLLESYYSDELKKLLRYAPIEKIKRYFAKQMHRENGHRYRTGGGVLTAWRDYLRECQELGLNTDQEHVLFPNNLYTAHTKTASRIKIKTDKSLNAKIYKRLKHLQKYNFEYAGFIVRPAKDSIELFQEGKSLSHCVGGYAERYAEGKTNIFVIRKESDPKTPFYTMEIVISQDGAKIVQCQGFEHCDPTPEVKTFIDAFTVKKLLTKKRIQVEVAV